MIISIRLVGDDCKLFRESKKKFHISGRKLFVCALQHYLNSRPSDEFLKKMEKRAEKCKREADEIRNELIEKGWIKCNSKKQKSKNT